MLWAWAILLLVLGLALAVMEVFFPSAGILGLLAMAAVIGAVVLGFQHDPMTGLILMIVALFGVPAVIVLAFHYWPRTPIGRRLLLPVPRAEDVLPDGDLRTQLRSLVGKVARAKCKMLPGGAVTVDGQTIDAVSEGQAVEVGQLVRVVQVRGMRLIVRPVEEDELSPLAEDPLRRPIESVLPDLPDPFDERPA